MADGGRVEIAVICGADARYASEASGVVEAARQAGIGHVLLAGPEAAVADARLPYVMRLDHLAMTPLLLARPNLADWHARLQARPSFDAAVAFLLPQMLIEMFRRNGESVWSDIELILQAA